MTRPGDASFEYLKSAVMTASQEQLQLMLLDAAIRHSERAIEGLKENKLDVSFTAMDKAQRIVLALSSGLRREVNPELVDRMAALYGFIFRRLVDANMQRSPAALDDALKLLRLQRETWLLLMDRLAKERHNGPTLPDKPEPRDDSQPILSLEG